MCPTAVIVDDELQLIAHLRSALATEWPELLIVGEAGNGAEALTMVEAYRPDLIFLDIRMPGLSGIEVARRLMGRCQVVFVTAYDDYAVQAFESAAVDYLLKPVAAERLAVTVARVKSRLERGPIESTAVLAALVDRLLAKPSFLQWLQVQQGQDVILVAVGDVDLFQSSEKYTLATSRTGEWVIRTPLKELEPQLDPTQFWRIHRNAIVRVGAIARVSRNIRGQVVVHLRDQKRTVDVSRAYAHLFRQM